MDYDAYAAKLFFLSMLGIIGWVLLIFLPRWSVTAKIIDEGIFPLYLSVLYTLALVPLLKELGPQLLVVDFSNMAHVRALFAHPHMWLVFWIHILAFDQVVAMLIYEDNMANKYLPVPLQSFVLTLVLFVGPFGMLVYLALRFRPRQRRKHGGGSTAYPGHAGATATV